MANGARRARARVSPAVVPPLHVLTHYTDVGMDYRAWSRNFNMHFGYCLWPANPIALEPMLEEEEPQVSAADAD